MSHRRRWATSILFLGVILIGSAFAISRGVLPVLAPSPASSATLLFVGDIMLSRSVGDRMAATNDWSWPFHRAASDISAADIAFANLESVVSDKGTVRGCGFCFRADPRSLQGLQSAGFDVVSVANNHAWDYGSDAFLDSMQRLQAAGISPAGGGRTLAAARSPVIKTTHGMRVAYLAYTDILPASACATDMRGGVNCYDAERMHDDIVRANGRADITVVSFHTGIEYETTHSVDQELIYRAAVDAGADLVIGHHPHVVQDIEQFHGGWIAYSLGNFIFDQAWSAATLSGLAIEATISTGHVVGIRERPVSITRDYQASLAQ